MTEVRSPHRSLQLFHGVFLGLLLLLPLLRGAWDLWAQSLVLLTWSFMGVLSCLLWFRRRPSRVPLWGEALRTAGPWLGAFFLLSVASAAHSAFPHSAMPGVLNDIPSLAFFFLAAGVPQAARVHYLRAVAGGAVLAVGTAFLLQGTSGALAGPLVNPNVLAGLLLLGGPLMVFLSGAFEVGPRERWLWRGGAALAVGGVFRTGSFFGYIVLGLEAAVGFSLWRRTRREKTVSTPFQRWSPLGALSLFVAGTLMFQSKWGRLLGEADRWSWWRSAAAMVKTHPLLGVGPGAFGEAYPAFRSESWGLNSLYAHNFLWEWAAERGLPSALILVVFLGLLLGRGFRTGGGRVQALTVGLGGFLLYNGAHIGFSFPGLAWVFFAAAGARWGETLGDPIPWTPRRRWSLVGAVAWGAVGFASFSLFRADQFTARARHAFAGGNLSQADIWVEEGLGWNRWSPELYNMRAALRLMRRDVTGAAQDMDQCLRWAPTSAGFHQDAAELALRRESPEEALRHYDAAVRFLPLNPPPWIRRGDLLRKEGREDEAVRSYENALRALSDPRVLGGSAEARDALRGQVNQRLAGKVLPHE